MLVLSRRLKEKIVFPSIEATVQVVSIKSGTVRLGIEAPSHVPVYREEVRERRDSAFFAADRSVRGDGELSRTLKHKLRNWLNTANLALALMRRQLQTGVMEGTALTLDTIEAAFQDLLQDIEGMSEPTPPPPAPATKHRKALLVEDDCNECELLAGLLRMSGFAVDTANDGATALAYLVAHSQNDRPDVMLLDMGLPRCDGGTVVRAIRGEPSYSGFKIFAVSGHRPEEYSLDSSPALVDRWFQKPIRPEELLRELNHQLLSA